MGSALPRSNTDSQGPWYDHDQYPTMNRGHSSSVSSAVPLSMAQGPNRQRNGFASNGEKAVPVPGSASYGNGMDRKNSLGGAPSLFDVARSPPNASNKNTKHVPCKFFRQGACQAGSACPFSHSLDPTGHQAPCKYFMKGNCKFGAKCALAHYLPDGRRVNRADLDAGLAMAGRGYGYANRQEQTPFPPQDPSVGDPMLNQPTYGPDYFPSQGFPLMDPDETDAIHDRYNQYQGHSALDSGVNSPPTSQFGSPTNDYLFPKSPVENLRTALNAPLPQSFDANGISHIAQYGPFGQSVPDKFGLRSPASSSLSRQLGSPPDSIVNVRNANLGSNLRNASPLGLSPQNTDESISQRIMHSQRPNKVRGLSASVPRSNLYHEWEDGLGLETELLPNSLHDEVLTPQEKMRRMSRPDQETNSKDYARALAIPSGSSSKVGSPPAGSPSRFSALWAEQREKKANDNTVPTNVGPVGSPLRGSWMSQESSQQVSGISQAMARMQLNRTDSGESNGGRVHSSGLRHSSAPIGRGISSPGLSSKKIDEEVEGEFFPMDGDDKNTTWAGLSPRLPVPERSNGVTTRNRQDDLTTGEGEIKSMWTFQS